MTRRWKVRPQGSNWGDFGDTDQLGRLNLLTPKKVLQGIAEVREGLTFCLSLPLDYPGGRVLAPHRFPPQIQPTEREGESNFHYPLEREHPGNLDVVCDDAVLLSTQYSTQWDALGHVGQTFDADGDGVAEQVYYNGYRSGSDVRAPADRVEIGDTRLGIENMAETSVQGRGVMIDLRAEFGLERSLVGYDELMHVLDKDAVEVEEGDIICIHTGFAQEILKMKKKVKPGAPGSLCAALDGYDDKLLKWISDSGVAAIAADNYSVEALPARSVAEPHAYVPLHQHCLFKLGIHLGELWFLSELNAWLRNAGRSRFLLTAPPLRLPGAMGSPVTPVATV